MKGAYKNFWSLNTDEAVVAGMLRAETNKDIEVLLPLNAQMKGVDLVLLNTKNKKCITIQVKGSRAYEPRKSEVKKYGLGSAGWFFLKSDTIDKATADFFIFLIYIIKEDNKIGRKTIDQHVIIIPTEILKKLSIKYKKTHGASRYSFLIWINPKTKEAFDFRDKPISFDDYLDKKGYKLINDSLNK